MAVLPRRQLQASTVWMALVPGSVLGHSKTALHPVLLTPRSSYPTLRVWALCLSRQRALGEGIRVLYQWPPWEGFPYGIGFDAMWLLFPFHLDSGWDSFLSGGSQLPRCCSFIFCVSVEEYFSFIFRIFFSLFFATKRTRLNPMSPLDRDLPVLTITSLVL